MKAKTYIVTKTSAMEAWDYLDEFSAKMDKFVSKTDDYAYTASVESEDDVFRVVVKVIQK